MQKIKYILAGIFIGMLLGGGITWAGMRYTLSDDNNQSLGTTTNPLFIISP